MTSSDDRMREIAHWLLAREAGPAIPPAALVCENLRRTISTLAGDMGFRSLLARALNLARVQAPGLDAVVVRTDGSIEGLNELPEDEVTQAGHALVCQLLALLSNFIGETLTLRLLQVTWPALPTLEELSLRSPYDATR